MTLPESFREFESWSPVKGATKHKCRSAWKKWMAFCGQYPGAGAAKFQVWLRDHAKCREAHHHARLTQEGRAGIIAGGGAFRALGRGGGASGEKPLNRNWSRVGNPARQSISIIDHQS